MTEVTPLRAERLKKPQSLGSAGHAPYPARFHRSHRAQQLQAQGQGLTSAEQFAALPPVRVCGRITAFRQMGGASFFDLTDGSGRIQLYREKETLGPEGEGLLAHLDVGDFLGVEGGFFRPKRGELSIQISFCTFLSRALLPMPEKWHGLKDTETR